MSDLYSAFAPASIANFGPGYDVFAVALDGLGDRVSARALVGEDVVRLVACQEDGGALPLDCERNTASRAVAALRKQLGEDTPGIELLLVKGVPVSSGLGGSAASAAAAVVAANAVLGRPLKKPALLAACREGERASGSAHGDNVAASLLGGAVLFDEDAEPLSLPVPKNLWLAVAWPGFPFETAESRALVPAEAALADAVFNLGRFGRLVDAFHRGDVPAIGAAMRDRLTEPFRLPAIEGGALLREAARIEGAHGFSICGSGPAVVAVCDGHKPAMAVEQALRKVLENAGHTVTSWVLKPSPHGAHLLPPGEAIPFPEEG